MAAGDYVFLAGQTARGAVTGKVIDGDIHAQTARALEIVAEILSQLGLSLQDVVRSTVYLASSGDVDAMNSVYLKVFQPPYPARSTLEAALPFGALVSLEVTAYRGGRAGR